MMPGPTSLPDQIAQSSIELYDALPAHGKPTKRNNGVTEWTILATFNIVLPGLTDCGSSSADQARTGHASELVSDSPETRSSQCATSEQVQNQNRAVIPISLGTGVKVLPYSKLPKRGDTIHDSHAEILARRGFVRWLIYQASLLARFKSEPSETSGGGEEVYVKRRTDGKFGLKDGIEIWLYVSMLPCGDASTLYTAAHQPPSEASQWDDTGLSVPNTTSPATAAGANDITSDAGLATAPILNVEESIPSSRSTAPTVAAAASVARGRRGYTALSTLRTKPGRPDSIPSISMSCSDKIASWCILGVQGALLASLYSPVYLDGIVVGGVDMPAHDTDLDAVSGARVEKKERVWKETIRKEVERAVRGRLEGVTGLPPSYTLHRPAIHFTPVVFPHSRSAMSTAAFEERDLIANVTSNSNGSLRVDPVISSTVDLDTSIAPSPLSLSYLPFLTPNARPNIATNIYLDGKRKTARPPKAEIISDGSLLGFPYRASATAPIREKGRPRVCKLEIMRAYLDLLRLSARSEGSICDSSSAEPQTTYYALKHATVTSTGPYINPSSSSSPSRSPGLGPASTAYRALTPSEYQHAKAVLRGVAVPLPKDQYMRGLEKYDGVLATVPMGRTGSSMFDPPSRVEPANVGSVLTPGPESWLKPTPFAGWLVSGAAFESFDADGNLALG